MFRQVAIAAIALAGVMHLTIAPGHFSPGHFPHGMFFVLIGTAQLLWALAFWRYISPILYWVGLAVSGGTINIWILTRLVSAPFGLPADVIDSLAIPIVSSELVGFVALVGVMGRGPLAAYTGRAVARLVGATPASVPTPKLESMVVPSLYAMGIALICGTVVWGGGHLGEVIFPGLGTHDQAHGVENRPPATDIPGRTPDLEAMIAAAVEAALTAQRTSAPRPAGDSDLQAMIGDAVEAALAAQATSALTPTPVGVPAGAGWGGKALAFSVVLAIIAGIGVWRLALVYLAAGRHDEAIGPRKPEENLATGRGRRAVAWFWSTAQVGAIGLREAALKAIDREQGPDHRGAPKAIDREQGPNHPGVPPRQGPVFVVLPNVAERK